MGALGARPVWAKPTEVITLPQFREVVLSKLKRDYGGKLRLIAEPAPNVLRLQRTDGVGSEPLVLLEGFYQQALRLTEDPQAFLAARLDPLVQPLTPLGLRLFPRLLARDTIRRYWGQDQVPPLTDLHPQLAWGVALDQPGILWLWGQREAQNLGLTISFLQTQALANLAQRTEIDFVVAGERNGNWVLNRGDGYDAERMLLPALLGKMRAQAGKPLLLTAPSHNWLVVSADLTAQDRLRRIAQRIQKDEPREQLPLLLFSYDQQLVAL